ncbi:hypothetical protein ACIBTP_36710 [Streptomyces avidinii]|uniref:hypothetical protein n=1 Tax=Streptomyces avidinii TaxID=1895 RepID=UPI0037AE4C56
MDTEYAPDDTGFAFTTEDAEQPIVLLSEAGKNHTTMIFPRAEPLMPTRFNLAG